MLDSPYRARGRSGIPRGQLEGVLALSPSSAPLAEARLPNVNPSPKWAIKGLA